MSYIRDQHCEAIDFANQHCEDMSLPPRCTCGNNGGGDCEWCLAWADYLVNSEAAIAEEANVCNAAYRRGNY